MEEVEKNHHAEELERVSTKDEYGASDHDLNKVKTTDTLAAVDLDNNQAFKGDDSDGRIQWTFRKWLAAGFLAMLYTGTSTPKIVDAIK